VVLARGVRTGPDRVYQLRRLVERYPLDALPAVEAALLSSFPPRERAALVTEVGMLPAAAPLLRSLLQDPSPEVCLSAARALRRRGEPEILPAVLQALRRSVDRHEPGDRGIGSDGSWPEDAVRLAEFVAGSGEEWAQLAAIAILARGEPETELDFLDQFPEGPGGTSALAAALDDRRVALQYYHEVNGKEVPLPRVCDVAATLLAARLAGVAEPKMPLSHQRRDDEVARIRNAWRRAAGMSLDAAPPSPVTPRRPPGGSKTKLGVANLVTRVKVEGLPASHPAAAQALGWKGQPFDVGSCARLFARIAQGEWREIGGWQLLIDRPGDGRGLALQLRLLRPDGRADVVEAGDAAVREIEVHYVNPDIAEGQGVDDHWAASQVQVEFQDLWRDGLKRFQDPARDFLFCLWARRTTG
jgi:hypothetical protein